MTCEKDERVEGEEVYYPVFVDEVDGEAAYGGHYLAPFELWEVQKHYPGINFVVKEGPMDGARVWEIIDGVVCATNFVLRNYGMGLELTESED